MTAYFLAGLGLAIALSYFPMALQPTSWLRSLLKTLPLLLFAGAAYQAGAAAFLVAGLFLSALGDYALSRHGRAAFLYGLSAFACAHLVYVLLFLDISGNGLHDAFIIAPLGAIAMIIFALSSELWLAPYTGKLRWPVRLYILLITAMGLAALSLPAAVKIISPAGEHHVLAWPVAAIIAGAGLFILSDLILSLRMFRMTPGKPRARIARRLVWLFYISGQFLILAGVAA